MTCSFPWKEGTIVCEACKPLVDPDGTTLDGGVACPSLALVSPTTKEELELLHASNGAEQAFVIPRRPFAPPAKSCSLRSRGALASTG